jgi:transcriptional regulator with XRE-family HTH domain
MNYGKAVRLLRESKKLSQTDLAMACDLTQVAISNIETEKSHPHQSTIERLAFGLNTTENVLTILAMEKGDFPKINEELYNNLWPVIESLCIIISRK